VPLFHSGLLHLSERRLAPYSASPCSAGFPRERTTASWVFCWYYWASLCSLLLSNKRMQLASASSLAQAVGQTPRLVDASGCQ
jgi:hypothetical protein